MKNKFTILLFILQSSITYAQENVENQVFQKVEKSDNPKAKSNNQILTFVEVDAEYPGGLQSMIQFLAKNIKYPTRAVVKNIEGKLTIRFVVDTKGKISGAKILRGMPECPECEAEALRVIKKMPKWKPALNNGKKVNAYFDLPIVFRLN